MNLVLSIPQDYRRNISLIRLQVDQRFSSGAPKYELMNSPLTIHLSFRTMTAPARGIFGVILISNDPENLSLLCYSTTEHGESNEEHLCVGWNKVAWLTVQGP